MIHTITSTELKFLEECLEDCLREFDGIDECVNPADYVTTTGAREECYHALDIVRSIKVNEENIDLDEYEE